MSHCRHYRVSGRVQGVFYRVSARDAAAGLGLTGWVRNTADGSVELKACGNPRDLEQLEKWLWEGPPDARVEAVEVQVLDSGDDNRGFEIRY